MPSKHRRILLAWGVIALVVTALVAIRSWSHRPARPRLRREYSDAFALAIDAVQKASQFRDSGAELFEPRKRDMVGDDATLQMLTKDGDPTEKRLSSKIATCDKALRTYRATFTQHNLLLTDQSGDIVDTCIATARQMFSAEQ